ncbi:trypsin-like serine protease [Gracilimonas mengyeensis]|nr:trypsin-like serine protease [Gracilimonas mengyeensis]
MKGPVRGHMLVAQVSPKKCGIGIMVLTGRSPGLKKEKRETSAGLVQKILMLFGGWARWFMNHGLRGFRDRRGFCFYTVFPVTNIIYPRRWSSHLEPIINKMQIIKNRLLSSPLHFAGIFLCLYAIAEIFIIIRADVNDSEYLVPDDAFPQLVDLPESGHGTLITSRWVVVAAHSVESEFVEEVIINNKPRKVSRVIIHSEFKASYDQLVENMDGVISLEKTPEKARTVINAKEAMYDIALIQLANPIEEIRPVKLLQTADEAGQVGILFGKGATGNGELGQYEASPNRQQLRRAQNKIEEARDKWLVYTFDCGDKALATEGVIGQ